MEFAFDLQGKMDDLTRQVDMLQREPGGPRGYCLRRIILVNFWLYHFQVFEVPHGRLLLAGNNASGKSTVLTAALPLALEGSLRPDRLDTFGGKHKHVDYDVLGDEASSTSFTHHTRTSYIALEFDLCLPDEEKQKESDSSLFAPTTPDFSRTVENISPSVSASTEMRVQRPVFSQCILLSPMVHVCSKIYRLSIWTRRNESVLAASIPLRRISKAMV